jgi:hypothetical protein
MNFIPIQLQQFVRESICPQKFIGKQISSEEFRKWKSFLIKEIGSLNCAVLDSSLTGLDIEALLLQIVNLSNIVNSYIFKKSSFLKNHSQARSIKEHYNYTLELFDGLILTLNDLFPVESRNVKISDSNLGETISGLKMRYYKLANHLNDSSAERDLVDIAISGVSKLIHKENITRTIRNISTH